MSLVTRWVAVALFGCWLVGNVLSAGYEPSAQRPPAPAREFRGAWLTTVGNIDWPSKPGLPTDVQKAELIALLDRAVQLKLNAILFQVRPSCDALYDSKLEPWSEYITGEMGKAPSPFYDPLALAVAEAHKRGLELHAWFNPFRARHITAKSAISSQHISRLHPEWTHHYGAFLWLDPAEKGVQDHAINVIQDVVRRYDIDGVHIDDYFYPYPEPGPGGTKLDFPDTKTWRAYQQSGGSLSKPDWRRNNVNQFVARLNRTIHDLKPWVRFGISPFGIWRPDNPKGIKGLDQYDVLFADARKWLAEGQLDYCAPQLYWSVDSKEQSFPVLLHWWAEQNVMHRHLWPGLGTYKTAEKFTPSEILRQIDVTRKESGASGDIHFSAKSVLHNQQGLSEQLMNGPYRSPALVPATTWLDNRPPERPVLAVETAATPGAIRIGWQSRDAEPAWLWVLQIKSAGIWSTLVLPGDQRGELWKGARVPEAVALSAIDRCGNQSVPSVVELPATAK